MLAFVASAINAGGFLAVQQYASHVTGMVSSVADNLALVHLSLVVDGLVAVLAFLLGAICCALMVNACTPPPHGQRVRAAAAAGSRIDPVLRPGGRTHDRVQGLLAPFTPVLLCFIMGLQNAVVTKLSNAVIRTTHLTAIVTDLGIELGRLLYWNHAQDVGPPVRADRERLAVLVTSFLGGGIAGALGFKLLGYVSTVPLAVQLAILALVPAWGDLRRRGGSPVS